MIENSALILKPINFHSLEDGIHFGHYYTAYICQRSTLKDLR